MEATDFPAKTLPLPCVSTAFKAKTATICRAFPLPSRLSQRLFCLVCVRHDEPSRSAARPKLAVFPAAEGLLPVRGGRGQSAQQVARRAMMATENDAPDLPQRNAAEPAAEKRRMCGSGTCAREASVWEACCWYSGVINMS